MLVIFVLKSQLEVIVSARFDNLMRFEMSQACLFVFCSWTKRLHGFYLVKTTSLRSELRNPSSLQRCPDQEPALTTEAFA